MKASILTNCQYSSFYPRLTIESFRFQDKNNEYEIFSIVSSPLFAKLNLLKPQDHIKLQTLFFMHQFNTGKLPKIFDSFFVKTFCKHNVNNRFASRSTFYLPKIRTNYGKLNNRFNWPKLWNELDERFKCRNSNQFKKELTSHFISLY